MTEHFHPFAIDTVAVSAVQHEFLLADGDDPTSVGLELAQTVSYQHRMRIELDAMPLLR